MSANRLLLKFALRYPLLVVSTVVLSFSGALFNGVSTALIVPLLLGFLGQEGVALKKGPPILAQFMSAFDTFPGEWRFIAMLGAVLLAIILKNATNYISSLVGTYLSRSLVNGMRLDGLQLLLDVDLDFYSKHKLGNVVNLVNQEVARTSGAIRIAIGMFTNVMNIFIFIAILLILSWQLTLAATGLLALVSFSNQYFIKRAKGFGRILSQKSAAYTNKLLEILAGIRLVKTVSREKREYQTIERYIREREKAELQSQANYAAISPLNEILGILTVLSIVLIGRYLFADRIDAISTIMLMYLLTLFRLIPFVGNLNGARSKFANAAPSSEIVADFLRRDNKPIMKKGHLQYEQLEKGIHFENVSFAYPGHGDLVLNDIDLWFPKGKSIALVGSSGAGKSTMADLLPRFYDPDKGRITLDGKDLRDFDLKSVHEAMGVVSQDTFLFNNTVRYNISYGREDATEEQIIDATKRANAYEFITQLPDGLDTNIGDRGVMLSGGQRQRLAIARALLRDPDILILDEATSALDTVSERLVQQAIDELCRERTTLVIAHRLSTVQKAYQIAVMEKGQIVELGSHEELLKNQDGHYARLYNMQFADKPKSRIVLPTNEALIRTSLKASHELRKRFSYEVRSRLNAMLGSLRLLSDDLIDTPEEQQELLEESYESAMQLLKMTQSFEENAPKIPLR